MNKTHASTEPKQPRIQSPASKAYWASVTRCEAKPDGSGKVVQSDGRVEVFDADGRLNRYRPSFPVMSSAERTLPIAA
jgi:hypothetical protein